MPSGKKKKRHKMSTHKRKKRLRKKKNKNKLFACSPMRIAFGLFLFFITLMPGLTMPYDLFMQTNISEKNNHLRLFTI